MYHTFNGDPLRKHRLVLMTLNQFSTSSKVQSVDDMKTYFSHLQLNIEFANLSFYQQLLEFMGWQVIVAADHVVGYHSQTNGDLWLVKTDGDDSANYDAKGINHLALGTAERQDVDAVRELLESLRVPMLFGTPRHRLEYASDENSTYYQIMFESPDKILFEVVYVGPKER
ncbi:MAG: hypothetical protein COU69_00235 [Candidatus Pacebacteria bacterium CG10_big_fil_rev_8_21_14_0_10_56_10]|nr:MAG: hypothetical protein COU69_00235 [Candidatus Pacebacteria bacterium CG10_big_fil_rev_8_21_14_0_10_56_10]